MNFDACLEYSIPAQCKAGELLSRAGWHVRSIHRDVERPDEGDLLIYRELDSGFIDSIRIVDAKRAREWTDVAWPFPTVMLTNNERRPHPDWWYIILSHDLTMAGFIDMSKVPPEKVTQRPTRHPGGYEQLSWQVPAQYMLVKPCEEAKAA